MCPSDILYPSAALQNSLLEGASQESERHRKERLKCDVNVPYSPTTSQKFRRHIAVGKKALQEIKIPELLSQRHKLNSAYLKVRRCVTHYAQQTIAAMEWTPTRHLYRNRALVVASDTLDERQVHSRKMFLFLVRNEDLPACLSIHKKGEIAIVSTWTLCEICHYYHSRHLAKERARPLLGQEKLLVFYFSSCS